jgi:hypothetical protein
MKYLLTQEEIKRTQQLCFNNPAKACAIAQIIIDTCQVVSCSTYAEITGKSKRTVQYQSKNLNGVSVEGRRFLSLNQ